MSLLTLLLFFVYAWGFGYILTNLIKDDTNKFLERNLMRVGIGLGAIPILGIFLSLLHIPLDWRLFLILSIVPSLYFLLANIKKIKLQFKVTKHDIYVAVVLLLFLGAFYMYYKGAFAYPYLEDDDPWSHAVGIKYISIEKTVFMPRETANWLQYINPYPPAYDMLFGILHQTSPSIMWTMKFFNALIISLSIIFFYFFVKEFIGNKKRALFSTFALAMVPCFLSHFIWVIALTVPLYFVAFYCTEKINKNKRWIIPSSIVIASTLTISPTHSVYFGFFFLLYFIAKTILSKKFLFNLFLAGFLGFLFSLVSWWGVMIAEFGFVGLMRQMGAEGDILSQPGSGDRPYSIGDFIFAKSQNMINNPVGIGVVLSFLLVISLVYIFLRYKSLLDEKNHWIVIALVWLAFTLYAVNSARYHIKLSPFRTWVLFAIPLCILVSEGFFFLVSLFKNNIAKIALAAVILGGIWFTSGYQKYQLNTTPGWPPGAFWTSMEELQGYVWLNTLPTDTKVFSFTNDGVIIGFDKFACAWCEDVTRFKEDAINKSAEELHNWLKRQGYQYITIGGQEAREFGVNITNTKINELVSSSLFRPVHSTAGVIIARIV